MTAIAILLIAASAGLHATWHMFAKRSGASCAFLASLATIGAVWSSFAHFAVPVRFFEMPLAFHFWLTGVIAFELVYISGLSLSYQALDMTTAYPMMRALPLLMLSVVTSAFGFGKPLGPSAIAAMVIVFAGCLLTPLQSFSDFKPSRYLDRSFMFILVVAIGTTGYTLCDSQAQQVLCNAAQSGGLNVSKPMLSLAYYSFRAVELAAAQWAVVIYRRKTRAEAVALLRPANLRMTLAAGVCASLTYLLVLVAMNFVTNVAYVQAFRQIGLIIGLAEGVFILRERCTAPKLVGLILIIVGLASLIIYSAQ